MTSIPDCLAAFSVAAMMNNPDAAARAKAAIGNYLECAAPEPARQIVALQKLYDAYIEMALDSTAALEIKEEMENRIIELAVMPPQLIAPNRHA